mmetsp:Transcript_27756/g.60844  ORF Transcript_27756/g.60844 Transcript_27756/m.60844 type:complete len:231 (+) Transcript_27756:640-1332(+)
MHNLAISIITLPSQGSGSIAALDDRLQYSPGIFANLLSGKSRRGQQFQRRRMSLTSYLGPGIVKLRQDGNVEQAESILLHLAAECCAVDGGIGQRGQRRGTGSNDLSQEGIDAAQPIPGFMNIMSLNGSGGGTSQCPTEDGELTNVQSCIMRRYERCRETDYLEQRLLCRRYVLPTDAPICRIRRTRQCTLQGRQGAEEQFRRQRVVGATVATLPTTLVYRFDQGGSRGG